MRRPCSTAGGDVPGDGTPDPVRGRPSEDADGRRRICFRTTCRRAPGCYAYEPDPATAQHPLTLISPASAHTDLIHAWRTAPGDREPEDPSGRRASRANIADGDSVRDLQRPRRSALLRQGHAGSAAGTVALAKGLWARSTFNGATANALVPDCLTDIAGGACFNDARVQVELLARHAGVPGGGERHRCGACRA